MFNILLFFLCVQIKLFHCHCHKCSDNDKCQHHVKNIIAVNHDLLIRFGCINSTINIANEHVCIVSNIKNI